MKYSFVMVVSLLSLFLVCEFFGLFVSYSYNQVQLPYGIEPPPMQPSEAVLYIISAIIFVTIFFLLLQRLKWKLFMKLWFMLAFVLCTSVSLSVFIIDWVALIIAFILIVLRMKEKDLYLHNLTEILIYGGAVAIFSPLLTVFSMAIIMIIISAYDFISVFITKHMITMAKSQSEEGIFAGLVIRFKDEVAILGGGDVAFPLMFASVVIREVSAIASIFTIYGATLGLLGLIILGKRKKFYPALPLITLGSFAGFLFGSLL